MTRSQSSQPRTRRRRSVAALAASAVVLPALVVPFVTGGGSASAASCAATPTLLSRAPVATAALPGGGSLRVWDTGTSSHPGSTLRLSVARFPNAALDARVVATSTLDRAALPRTLVAGLSTSVVTVNGGYFNGTRGAIPVMMSAVNGVLRKATATRQDALATYRTASGTQLTMVRVTFSGRTASRHMAAQRVVALNWQSVATSGVTVYTSAWGTSAHPHGTVGVLVGGGRVIGRVSTTSLGRPVAAGRLLLTGSGATATALTRLVRGESVSLAYGVHVARVDTGATLTGVVGLVGSGGTPLLAGVNRARCDSRSETRWPRTMVGFTPSGDVLVVTAAAHIYSPWVRGGLTMHQMTALLYSLGARYATPLDSDTSTTMLYRTSVGGSLARADRAVTGYQRPVPDALTFTL